MFLLIVTAFAAPLITAYDPIAVEASARLQPPSVEHFMGTDAYGRDVLSRILYGGRVSLLVAFVSVAFALADQPGSGWARRVPRRSRG